MQEAWIFSRRGHSPARPCTGSTLRDLGAGVAFGPSAIGSLDGNALFPRFFPEIIGAVSALPADQPVARPGVGDRLGGVGGLRALFYEVLLNRADDATLSCAHSINDFHI